MSAVVALGLLEDGRVVDACEDEVALCEVRLVLLALLDRGVSGGEVFVAGEALHRLLVEISVRHRVADDRDPLTVLPQQLGDPAGRLALSRASPDRADGDD